MPSPPLISTPFAVDSFIMKRNRPMLRLRCKQCDHKTTGTVSDKCFKCGAVDWEQDKSPIALPAAQDSNPLPGLVIALLALLGWLFYMMLDRGEFDDSVWVYHDKMASVIMKDWVNGEYKQCTSFNSKEQPVLLCGDGKTDNPKLFNVRFYGRTYQSQLGPNAQFNWNCKRDASDPMFVCKRQEPK